MFDNNNETYAAESQNYVFLPDLNIVKYDSSYFNFKELLQELYIILLNTETESNNYKVNEFINNFLFEYDLDPKNVFEIITSNPQNISCYSSLIGLFYQQGIGCKVDKIKAFEMFSKTVKNNQKVGPTQLSFNQKDESINFCNYDIKKLNEMISQYLYSILFYKNIIFYRKNNYQMHVENAEKGDPVSQYYIGNCYFYGKNIKQDCDKAIEWYLKSSEGGNIKATYMLGLCYYYGNGFIEDKKKAFELYLKSAIGGYRNALEKVGFCYEHGEGILKDTSKAFEWYLKAANKGDSYYQYLVAKHYDCGKYIPKNEAKGFYWNRKAAINGDINAQHKLARYYLNDSINENERKAFKWYLRLANKEFLEAVYSVANCYRDGIGTDKNLDDATKWFKKYESIILLRSDYRKKSITLNDFLNGSNTNY